MMELLIPSITATFAAACTIAYLTKAKRIAPLTLMDAKIMWQLHKNNVHCVSRKWQPLRQESGETVGFQCDCGYKYLQKRPFISQNLKHVSLNSSGLAGKLGGRA